jgi:hypothetical protein
LAYQGKKNWNPSLLYDRWMQFGNLEKTRVDAWSSPGYKWGKPPIGTTLATSSNGKNNIDEGAHLMINYDAWSGTQSF